LVLERVTKIFTTKSTKNTKGCPMAFGISAPIQAYVAEKIAVHVANLVIFVRLVVCCILPPLTPALSLEERGRLSLAVGEGISLSHS
jgi:hypothetical protein